MDMDLDNDYMDSHEFEEEEEVLTHAEHKENGNSAYKSKDYRGAIMHYTLAIETASPPSNDTSASASEPVDKDTLATYYNNRAAASTMILQYEDALADCESILSFHAGFFKAYTRKAKILTLIGNLTEANEAYNLALSLLDDDMSAGATINRTSSTISTTTNTTNDSSSEKAKIQSLQKELKTLQQRVTLIQSLLEIKNDTSSAASNGTIRDLVPLLSIPRSNASQALKQINLILSKPCPQYKDLLPYKLQSFVITEQFNDAYTLSSTLLRSSNNDSMILYYRSYILYRKGSIQDALKHLKQILRMNPDHKLSQKLFKALKALLKQKESGDEKYKSKNNQEAFESYSEAIENPICVGLFKSKLYYNRSCTLYNLKKYSECVKDCNNALRIDDEYVKVYTKRGNAYTNLETCEEKDCMSAIQDFEKAMELLERTASASGSSQDAQMKEIKTRIHETKIQMKQLKQKDFYKILNVSRNATQNEIKKSYRKMALKFHPDRQNNKSDEEKEKAETLFKDVNLAYEVLSDETKKRKYDNGVDIEDLDNPHAGQGHGGGFGGMSQSDLFNMFMSQQHGGMGGFGGMGGGRGGPSFHFG